MSTNNPFAAALNEPDSYVHHRDPPPVPRTSSHGGTPPDRPPKPEAFAPPSYEEAAGPEAARSEYPREKAPGSSRHRSSNPSGSTRQHRSHSHGDASRPHRSSRDREHRDRDREHRDREKGSSSSRHHKSSSGHRSSKKSPKKPDPVKPKNLDTIDKLDVTGFFGGGFHHDGPFDACTPHRNKNVKQAPVAAYAPDGPNSSIKGFGGTDKNQQMNLAFGQFEEDQNEIIGRKTSIKVKREPIVTRTFEKSDDASIIPPSELSSNPSIINFASNLKAEPVHGSTTAGLGSSTFIDGAPAPKIADDFLNTSNGGLGRKKSLVQRLRKTSHSENSTRRNSNDSSLVSPEPTRRGSLNNVESADELTAPSTSGGTGSSLLRRVKSLKVRR